MTLRFTILTLFTTAVLLACKEPVNHSTQPNNALLRGRVMKLNDGHALAGARVSLYYHEVQMFREGLYIGGQTHTRPICRVLSNEKGEFVLPAFTDTTGLPTYALLQVSKPGFESMYELFIPLHEGKNEVGKISLRNKAQFVQLTASHSGARMRFRHDERPKAIFTHDEARLRQCFPAEKLKYLPSIKTLMPQGGYAKFYRPQRGYNEVPKDFSPRAWTRWNTLLLPLELAVAGVTEGEVGLFTEYPEALKTQAVWVRTYMLNKAQRTRQPQNFQLAFQSTLAGYSLRAAQATRGLILTHPAAYGGLGNPITAVFSSRCNGDFTQSGDQAKWRGCSLGGNRTPYLLAVACSKHPNCHQAGLRKGCCRVDDRRGRYIYGHGAGGCQHGMRDFAARGWAFFDIATYFFYGSELVPFHRDVW
ncbi:MAG: hypothetical protein D6730_04010 [Bacteroidetes bacterium]|nr:MAG: hypothetical protein D6730_04010 [Bacteroidota bacterium]